jgi:hypothetical protein
MRNFLTTSDIARMAGRSPAQILKRWKAGLIPARNVNTCGKQLRLIDSPELRMWCEMERRGRDYWLLELIKTITTCIMLRDRGADAPNRGDVTAEIIRQLLDSKNPAKLIEKWARALRDQRLNDLPQVL